MGSSVGRLREEGVRAPRWGRVAVSPRKAVLLVGVVYLITQILLFSPHRAPSWDEAVYLSQISARSPAVFFAPSRARGITLLVAPVVATTGSLVAVRVFLEIASSLALTAVVCLWVPIIGWAAPVAAFLFGFSWLGLFYGSEVMPNLWAALLAVAAAGYWARSLEEERGLRELAFGAGCLGLMALFRPLDSLPVAGALVLSVSLMRRSVARRLVAIALGMALGWAPWLIEMAVRFDGPVAAVNGAASVGHVGFGSTGRNVVQYLYLTDGPTIGPDASTHISAVGVLWWSGLVLLVALALTGVSRGSRSHLLVTTLAGVALEAQYFFFVRGLAPRFLLPGYALLAVPAAVGAETFAHRGSSRIALGVGVGLLLSWGLLQASTAIRIERMSFADRAALAGVGSELRRLAGERACSFTSAVGFPQIQFASGCSGRPLNGSPGSIRQSLPQALGGADFLVVPASTSVPLEWKRLDQMDGIGRKRLVIYRLGSP